MNIEVQHGTEYWESEADTVIVRNRHGTVVAVISTYGADAVHVLHSGSPGFDRALHALGLSPQKVRYISLPS